MKKSLGTPFEKFYVVAFEPDDSPDHEVWTISIDPNKEGWNTDGGYGGYGLPKPMAEFLVNAANKELERIRNETT